MDIIRQSDIPVLRNSGVESAQLLFPESAPDARVTITRVTIPAGGVSPRHRHEASEQTWVALAGHGTLLLGEGQTLPIHTGDVARFAPGDVHGFKNTGNEAFVYLSVTTPPLNFRQAYDTAWDTASNTSSNTHTA
ncbi:MAG TPA: cupin domain-containing protein [Candidatus Aquabacterium excrementipullorum]|nr:cupin domain-containing protein [Candidatus Aquabacterium excrementipullorum]